MEPVRREIHYERPVRPALPNYIRLTKYGQDAERSMPKVDEKRKPHIEPSKRRDGSAILSQWPDMSQLKPTSVPDTVEPLPWKLLPCPLMDRKVPVTTAFRNDRAQNRFSGHRAVIANRHIPSDASVYYIEFEGRCLRTATIGLLKLKIKNDGSSTSGSSSKNGHSRVNSDASITRLRSNTNTSINDMSFEQEDDLGIYENGMMTDESYDGPEFDAYEEEEEEEEDDDDDDDEEEEEEEVEEEEDDDDDEEEEIEDVGIPSEVDEDDEDDDDDDEDDIDGDSSRERFRGMRTSPDFFKALAFPFDSVNYRSKSGDASLILTQDRHTPLYCAHNMIYDTCGVIDRKGAKTEQVTTRKDIMESVGILVDRVNQKLHFIRDDIIYHTMDLELPQPIYGPSEKRLPGAEEESEAETERTELFPMILFSDGIVNVRFGDGNLGDDGFRYDIIDYMETHRQDFVKQSSDLLDSNPPMIGPMIKDYLKFYGYASALGEEECSSEVLRNQKLRQLLEAEDYASAKEFVGDLPNSQNALFAINFAEYVKLARSIGDNFGHTNGHSRSHSRSHSNNGHHGKGATGHQPLQSSKSSLIAQVLDMGKQLLQQAEGDIEKQQSVREASAIILTREPRAPEIKKFYDEKAKTKLLSDVLSSFNPETFLRKMGAIAAKHSQTSIANHTGVQYQRSQVLAVLRDEFNGDFWTW